MTSQVQSVSPEELAKSQGDVQTTPATSGDTRHNAWQLPDHFVNGVPHVWRTVTTATGLITLEEAIDISPEMPSCYWREGC